MAQLTIPEVQAIQAELNVLKSKRARLFKAMLKLLETITKDRGYTQTVMEVSEKVALWRDKAKEHTPVIFLIDDETQIVPHAGKVREYLWNMTVFGVVREMDEVAFEEFIADIEECIDDNNTLFGQINKMEVTNILTDNQLFSGQDGTRLFSLDVRLEYTRGARQPR